MTNTKFRIITGAGSFEVEIPGEGWLPFSDENNQTFIVVDEEHNKENN